MLTLSGSVTPALRGAAGATALASVVSGSASLAYFGGAVSCAFGVLFDRASRFTDLGVTLSALNSSNPWQSGFEYPPGSLAAAWITRGFDVSWFGSIARGAFEVLVKFPSANVATTCPTNSLTGATLGLLLFSALTLATFVGTLLFRGAARSTRMAAAGITGLGFMASGVLIDFYPLILLVVNAAFLLALVIARLGKRTTHPIWFSLPFATAYPLLFGWDRGNLDLLAGDLVLLAAIAWSSVNAQVRAFAGPLLLGLAAAIKFWPLLIGGMYLRPLRPGRIAVMGLSFVALSVMGTLIIGTSVVDGFSGFVTTFAQRGADPANPWLLVFNRTATSGLDTLWYILRVPPEPPGLAGGISVVRSVLAVSAIPLAILIFMLPGSLWWRFTLSSTVFLLLSATSGAYRLTLLLVALGLLVVEQQREGTEPAKRQSRVDRMLAPLIGLAASPLFIGSFGPPRPEGATWNTPSDTLLGVATLVALLIVLVIVRPRMRRPSMEQSL